MKTAVIIIGIILLLFAAVLFLPVSVFIKFKEDFFLKIRFAGIKVFEIEPKRDLPKRKVKKSADKVSDKKAESKTLDETKRLFSVLKKRYGFTGAVKEVLRFAGDILAHIKSFLRHIKIKKVELDITVAAEDAAATAIEYGAICSAVYPVTAALSACAKIGFRSINVKSDFDGKESDFWFSMVVKLNIFCLLIVAFRAYSEYKKFTVRNELQ